MTRSDLIQRLNGLPTIFSNFETEQTRVPIGAAGKNAIAHLEFTKCGGKTCLTDLYNELPAKILSELYYDPYLPDLPYILFVNPTGGIVQGDRYVYKIRLNEGTQAFITETMATKVYKMDLNYASKYIDIYLSKNSRLEFLPKEIITFANSRWYQSIFFHVDEGSKFLYSEIFCPGRIARGEFWDFDIFTSKLMIEQKDKILLTTSSIYTKEDKQNVDIMLGDKKFLFNAYWYSNKANAAKKLIEFNESTYGGVTDMPYNNGIIIKALSNSSDDLKTLQLNIWRQFRKLEVGTEVPSLRMY